MARIRYLKPEFFSDESLAEFKFETRITYAGLWCYADKEGRLEDRPKYLKAMIFPYDNIDMEKQLDLLSSCKNGKTYPFIQRYEINDLKLIQIINWHKHQKPHHTEKESCFPPAPPFTEKGMEKGMEKQLKASTELRNGEITVKKPLSFVLPDYIPQETWDAYLKLRKRKKAESTDYALSLIVKELEKIKHEYGHDPVEVLNKSIKSGWTDVYPIKEGGNDGKGNQGSTRQFTTKKGGAESDGQPYPIDFE